MPRMWKKIKQYERHFLLGLVIILLATFSISGTIRGCSRDRSAPGQKDEGGSVEAAPGQRVEYTSEEFNAVHWRYEPVYRLWGPSLKYSDDLRDATAEDRMSPAAATWTHIATVEAAKAAGYAVSEDELQQGIQEVISRGRGRQLQFSPELYDQVLQLNYKHQGMPRSKAEFEATIKEVLLKDKFLTPLIESMRFSKSRKEAYADWKGSREHLELDYVGVPAPQFLDRVTKEESTRTAISKQETALADAVLAAPSVARFARIAKEHQQKNGNVPAKDADELKTKEPGAALLSGKIPEDPWKHPLVYSVKDGVFSVNSLGRDGKEGGGDDVGPEVSDTLSTLGTLRTVADALLTWKKTTEAWPDALEKLTTAPPGKAGAKTVAPLVTLPKDAWSRELAYDAAGPTLLSVGLDGQRGTADDVPVKFEGDAARIPLPALLESYVDATAADTWGRPLARSFKPGSATGFDVVSLGEDGVLKTDDDITTGNAREIESFYYGLQSSPKLSSEFTVPWKREFVSLWAVLPLVSDEALKLAWKENPEWRPDESDAYNLWRKNQGSTSDSTTLYYKTRETSDIASPLIDPADPVKGHGVDALEQLKKAGQIPASQKGVQVPAAADFGDRGEAPKEGPAPATDPLYKTYVEKGWRLVVLRELFFDKMLNKALQDARKSKEEIDKWTKAGSPGGKAPTAVTFDTFMSRIAAYLPSQADRDAGVRFVEVFKTDKPMTREEVEKVPQLSDMMVTLTLNQLKDDAYSLVPTTIKAGSGRAIFHVTKYHPNRQEDLADVRDTKVMPRYLESRSLDRAAKELDRVRTEAKPPAKIADLVKAAAEKRHFEFFTGSTGPLIAKVAVPEPEIPEGTPPAEVERIRRRAFVREKGAVSVARTESRQDATGGEVGAVGRSVLRDDSRWHDDPSLEEGGGAPSAAKGDESKSTDSAYLVQVAARSDPAPSEMNPRRYAEWLRDAAYGEERPRGSLSMSQRKGFLTQDLVRWFSDWDEIKHTFQIRTNHPIELPTPVSSN